MEPLPGHQPVVESLWTSRRHFTTSGCLLEKEKSSTSLQNGQPSKMTPSGTHWPSNCNLPQNQQMVTTKPRPVFSPQTSYSFKQQPLIPPPSVSITEVRFPTSNSDFLVGSINQRDQFDMDTPLNTPSNTPLPLPPPCLSGARLGAIIVL